MEAASLVAALLRPVDTAVYTAVLSLPACMVC